MLEQGIAPVQSHGADAPDPAAEESARPQLPLARPVAVLAAPEQLAPLAWAFAQAAPDARLGHVHEPGDRGHATRALLEQGLLAGELASLPPAGAAGAIYAGVREEDWDALACLPGRSAPEGGAAAHTIGALAALEDAHAALALGCPTVLVAQMSGASGPGRVAGMSPQTMSVLDLLLAPVTVALPAGLRSPVGAHLRAGLGSIFTGDGAGSAPEAAEPARPARITRHDWRRAPVDLPGFAALGIAAGGGPARDPLLFGAALAAGTALAELVAELSDEAGG